MRIALFILLCALSVNVDAATLYCSPSGGGSGADFNNLATMPTTTGFTRGNTYVLVEGAYGAKTFSTATSGSSLITIRKANAADSAVAGYASSLHDGQATFGALQFNTSYWLFDGITRNDSDWESASAYGFSMTAGNEMGIAAQQHHVTIRYLATDGNSAGDHASVRISDFETPRKAFLTFSRMLFRNSAIPIFSNFSEDVQIDHSSFDGSFSKECIRHQYGERWKIFNNKFRNNGQGSGPDGGLTAVIGLFNYGGGGSNPNDTDADDGELYGNIFYKTLSGNNLNDALVQCVVSGWKVYNNTVHDPMNAGPDGYFHFTGSGNVARNNMIYGAAATLGPNLTEDKTWVNPTASLENTSYVGTEDPFVDSANNDYRLKSSFSGPSPIDVGENLGVPYNVDLRGVTRGQGSGWDIGALERDDGTDTADPAIAITSPTSSATYDNGAASSINISGTASDNIGVTVVSWSNDRGGSGTATGTTSWSVNGITLQSGENVLTVTAVDATANDATDTLTVTYTPISGTVVVKSKFRGLSLRR